MAVKAPPDNPGRRPRLAAGLVAVLAASTVAVLVWRGIRSDPTESAQVPVDDNRSGREQPTDEDRLFREVHHLAGQLAVLRQRVESLADERIRGELDGGTAAGAVVTSGSESDLARADLVAEVEPGVDGATDTSMTDPLSRKRAIEAAWARMDPFEAEQYRSDGFRAKVESESSDWTWSGRTEDGVAEALAGPNLGEPSILQSDCRTTLCALTLRFATPAERERFFYNVRLTGVFAELGEFYMHCENPEDTEVEVFVARDGNLPAILPPGIAAE